MSAVRSIFLLFFWKKRTGTGFWLPFITRRETAVITPMWTLWLFLGFETLSICAGFPDAERMLCSRFAVQTLLACLVHMSKSRHLMFPLWSAEWSRRALAPE